jgi:hypothetical protein
MSFVPRSNGQTSLSTRYYGPGRWVPTASRGIRRAFARTPPSTSSGFVWPYRRYCYRVGTEVLEPRPAPTSSFRTTSPVCSATRFAGLLHPAADPGVRYVSARLSVEPAPKARPLLDLLPAGHRLAASSHRVSHPSKEFPSPQPHRIAATVASSDFSSSSIRDPRCRRRFQRRHLLSYRWDLVPRGLSPRRSPYLLSPYADDRRPLLPGPCSPPRFPYARTLRFEWDVRGALHLDRPSHARSVRVCARSIHCCTGPSPWSGETRSVPCPLSCVARDPRFEPREFDVFLVEVSRLFSGETAQFGRGDVVPTLLSGMTRSIGCDLHRRGGRACRRSCERGITSSSLERCSFGHRGWRIPRGIGPDWQASLRGCRLECFLAEGPPLRKATLLRESSDDPARLHVVRWVPGAMMR